MKKRCHHLRPVGLLQGLGRPWGSGLLLLLLLMVCWTPAAWSQKYSSWRAFRTEDKLHESYSTALTLSPRGNVWVKHGPSQMASVMDGFKVKIFPAPGPPGQGIYESRAGQLWSVYPEGLQVYKNGEWNKFYLPDIRWEFQTQPQRQLRPFCLVPVEQDRVLYLLSDKLMEWNAAEEKSTPLLDVHQTHLGQFLDLIPARDGGVWISGIRGVLKLASPLRSLKAEAARQEFLIDPALGYRDLVRPFEDDQGGLMLLAEANSNSQQGLAYFDGQQWRVQDVAGEHLRAAWKGLDGRIWGATATALLQWENGRRRVVPKADVPARQIFDVAIEPQGVFWVATSEGVFRYAPPLWRTPAHLSGVGRAVHGLVEDKDNRLWVAHATGLGLVQEDQYKEYTWPLSLERYFQPNDTIYSLANGSVVMAALVSGGGLEGGGSEGGNAQLVQFDPLREAFLFVIHPSGESVKPLGLYKEGVLCVQVMNRGPAQQPFHLELYDGERFSAFPEEVPWEELGSSLHLFFAGQNGNLWICGNRAMAWFHDHKWQLFSPNASQVPQRPVCMVETAEGKIWCGDGDRIWEFDGKKWGEKRFMGGAINALVRARDGSLWVAANNGLHHFYKEAWVSHGLQEGLPNTSINKVYEDRRGTLWAGTSQGVSRFHLESDPDPPHTSARRYYEDASPIEGQWSIHFAGEDKWKFTPTEQLLFSYRLDNQEWTPFTPGTSITLTDLVPGKHLQVRAMDRNCNIDPNPVFIDLSLPVPWYKETRLILIAACGLAVALFFASLAFNRHRQLVRSYAQVELQVALRTQQLEKANQALLHSQKMHALGTLAAGVAHDFNNILSIIKGSAQIIEGNLEDREKIRIRVSRIKIAVDQGAGIVKAMLGFSRITEKQLTLCELNAVVEETLRLLGDRFLKEVEIHFDWGPSLPQVVASKNFLQQMLLNLILNAADAASERHGIIQLRTGQMNQIPSTLVLAPAAASRYLFVEVKDNGMGIAPDVMSHIFEPFFTTKALSARRGTGLGLSMVYELGREMGCGIMAQSTPGEGSLFTIILPVNDQPGLESPNQTGYNVESRGS